MNDEDAEKSPYRYVWYGFYRRLGTGTMSYAAGDVSGAHMNPAVTIGFCAAGRLPVRRVLPYLSAQLIGAIAASLLHRMMFGNTASLGATMPAGPTSKNSSRTALSSI